MRFTAHPEAKYMAEQYEKRRGETEVHYCEGLPSSWWWKADCDKPQMNVTKPKAAAKEKKWQDARSDPNLREQQSR